MPVLLGEMKYRLGKTKLHSIILLLYQGLRYYIVLGKQTQKLCKKNIKPVHWKTQGGELQKTHQSTVEIVLPEMDATKRITWDFHVGESQGNHKDNNIIGHDIFPELQIDLRFDIYWKCRHVCGMYRLNKICDKYDVICTV